MHVDDVFVSDVLGRDVGHKMRRYLALGDAAGQIFSRFLVYGPPSFRGHDWRCKPFGYGLVVLEVAWSITNVWRDPRYFPAHG
jgi:hypothetical protein